MDSSVISFGKLSFSRMRSRIKYLTASARFSAGKLSRNFPVSGSSKIALAAKSSVRLAPSSAARSLPSGANSTPSSSNNSTCLSAASSEADCQAARSSENARLVAVMSVIDRSSSIRSRRAKSSSSSPSRRVRLLKMSSSNDLLAEISSERFLKRRSVGVKSASVSLMIPWIPDRASLNAPRY